MRFYNQRHEFYCGIDLHANSMHVCVVDHEGGKQLHRNFETRTPERFLQALDPYRDRDLIVGCESTFNWYWLADLCSVQNLPFLLGHHSRSRPHVRQLNSSGLSGRQPVNPSGSLPPTWSSRALSGGAIANSQSDRLRATDRTERRNGDTAGLHATASRNLTGHSPP